MLYKLNFLMTAIRKTSLQVAYFQGFTNFTTVLWISNDRFGIKVKEFYKNKTYAEPTDVIKRYAKKKILIEYSDSLGKTLSCTISGKQIAFGNKKVKDAEVLKFCLTRLDDMFYNGNDMAQFYHIEDKIKPEGKLSITVEHKDSTEILIKDKVVDVDRVMYNEKLYELIDYISNLSEKLK